jgi:hypothetical protein
MVHWVETEIVGDGSRWEWEVEHGRAWDFPTVEVWDAAGQQVATTYVAAWPGDGMVVVQFDPPPAAGARLQVRIRETEG